MLEVCSVFVESGGWKAMVVPQYIKSSLQSDGHDGMDANSPASLRVLKVG